MLEGCFECWWCWWMLGGQAGWVADGGNCHHENPTSREVWQSPMLSSWVYHQWLSRILSCRTLLQSPSRSSWSPWQREGSGSARCRRCFLVVSVPLYRRPTARLSFRSAGHRIRFMLLFCPRRSFRRFLHRAQGWITTIVSMQIQATHTIQYTLT